MKSILMSYSPYWYYLTGERIKKIECRKVKPTSKDWNGTIECYMTKDEKSFNRIPKEFQEKYRKHFGKVGMRFVCNNIATYKYDLDGVDIVADERLKTMLTRKEINIYAHGKTVYGLHISNLRIYDAPRELSEFVCRKRLTSPPQSWCYVEVSK